MNKQDELLEQKLSALESGAPLEKVLSNLPEEETELASLIRLAYTVRNVLHPEIAQEKVQVQRQTLQTQARRLQHNTSDPFASLRAWAAGLPALRGTAPWALPLAAVAAIVLVCMVGSAVLGTGLWLGGLRGAQTARLMDVNGQVQVFSPGDPGFWQAASSDERVQAGQRIRTMEHSSATLVFADGSRTTLGPQADVALTRLDRSWNGVIHVLLTQSAGKTSHSVVPFEGKQSSFMVQTPSGILSVHGTNFDVGVAAQGNSFFAVNSGQVLVANEATELFLNPGQATAAQPGGALEAASYQFQIQGVLSQMQGSVWTVSDVRFTILAETLISDVPEIGQNVQVTGRVLEGGEWVADSIEPVDEDEASEESSTFVGVVQAKDGTTWQIGEWSVSIDSQTEISLGVQVGSTVRVSFTQTEDGLWVAQKIELLENDEDISTPTPGPTPDTQAMPSLGFEDDELEIEDCDASPAGSYDFTGVLRNNGSEPKDYAAGVELAYQVIKGAEFVDSVELSPSTWERIESGDEVTFNIHVELNAAWQNAPEESEVKIRVFVANEINRPDHLPARLTATISTECGEEEDETQTPTATLAASATQTPGPSPTPTASSTPGPSPTAYTNCTGAQPHPTGVKLANRFGVTYEEIMGWFCQGFGFGEIDLAYDLSRQSGVPVADIFALRRSGLGWGEIKKLLSGLPTGTITPTTTVTATITATPDPFLTPTPTGTPGPSATPGSTNCTGADPHPTGVKLANRFGVTYEEIMGWFCQGFGFGEIDQAYDLSRQTGIPVANIFAMRSSGMGWGEIKKQLLGKPNDKDKPNDKGNPPGKNKPPKNK